MFPYSCKTPQYPLLELTTNLCKVFTITNHGEDPYLGLVESAY